MISESRCPVVDGELYVRSGGTGPVLLMIPGGIGSADTYRTLATALAAQYTVVTYDRRGHFRSTDETTGSISVELQADDAYAVAKHLGTGPVLTFGTSAGALIGLDLVARYPDAVSVLVAHEPPAVQLLPDALGWLDAAAGQVRLARSGDLMGAFKRFTGAIAGAALPELRAVRLPNEQDWKMLFDREITAFFDYLPDLRALRKARADIIPAAGKESRGHYHYQPAKVLALELGLPFAEMPGAHLAPQRNPAQFAPALTNLLTATD
ncbi:alpha/beta fold hydrolase [Amycolatopsis sp. H20-H5]|uniref:alpha/beta fold hydrolase n=1 Tax=Amycolatopsis sp. H20-H5 TaxID=3046309 RepID=UPI002DB593D6|nr:alpha/beta hydrolase [Amycolatopsis sp. H20-H5]MEC3974815.1 alpha/beta hydrolase [Amycolatopsis sp. H20-H5]